MTVSGGRASSEEISSTSGVLVPLPDEVPASVPEADEISSLLALPTETVIEALNQLPPELRAPLELLALRGKRYREIAEELSVPINTVGTRIRRARHMLQNVFAGRKSPGGGQ